VVTPAGLDLLAKLDGQVESLNVHLMRGADEAEIRRLIEILAAVRSPLRSDEEMAFPHGNGTPSTNGGDPEAES